MMTADAARGVRPELRRLRHQLLALALGLVLVSGLLLALKLGQQRAHDLDSGQRLNESLVRVVETQVAGAVQAVDQRLQLTAQGLALLDASGGLNAASATDLLRQQEAALPHVLAIWVLDAAGRVAYATNPANIGREMADRAYFQVYLNQPQTGFYLGHPIRSRASGRWVVSAARPLQSASGAFAGVVVTGLDPQYFERLWHALDLGDGGAVALLRRDGALLMRSPWLESAMGQSFAGSDLFSQRLAAQPHGSYTGPSPVDGRQRLNAYRSLAGPPELLVLVGRSTDTVLAHWRDDAWLAGAIWAAAAAVIGLLSVALERAWRQRLLAAAQARQTADWLMLATEAAGIGVWDWDLHLDQLQASPTWYAIAGQAVEHGPANRQRVLDTTHPDDRAMVAAKMQSALDGDDAPYGFESRVQHADGSQRWMQVIGRVMARDAAGRPTRLLGVRIDITGKQQLLQQLQAGEARFRALFEQAAVGVAHVALDGNFALVNQRFADITGRSRAELQACGFQQITHPDDLEDDLDRVQQLQDGEIATYSVERRYLRPDGRAVWTHRTMAVVRDSDGHPQYLVAHVQDISQRKALEQALGQSQARLRATLEALPDLMFEIGLDGRFHDYSALRTDLLAAPPQAFIGRLVSQTLPAEAAAESMAALQEADATGYSSGRQYALDLPQGRHWFELSVARKPPVADEGPRFIVLSRDITERRQGEAALRRALAEQGALLKEVHHRVKNNLQIVHSLLRLEAGRSGQPETAAVLRDMRGRVQAMSQLHELIYRSGRFAAVDLGDYLRQVATQAMRALQSQAGAVRLQLELASVRLDLDQALPCGLLVNELISNSLKHGFADGRSGEVQVTLQLLGGGAALQLCVSDNGAGLPADFEARRGRSLGLQLVADLAQQLGARLDIGPAPAAIFSVTFEPTGLQGGGDSR